MYDRRCLCGTLAAGLAGAPLLALAQTLPRSVVPIGGLRTPQGCGIDQDLGGTFQLKAAKRLKTCGVANLDENIGLEVDTLNCFFGVRRTFSFYDDHGEPNAKAVRTDPNTVLLLGVNLVAAERSDSRRFGRRRLSESSPTNGRTRCSSVRT